jgi:hypothetical protein
MEDEPRGGAANAGGDQPTVGTRELRQRIDKAPASFPRRIDGTIFSLRVA